MSRKYQECWILHNGKTTMTKAELQELGLLRSTLDAKKHPKSSPIPDDVLINKFINLDHYFFNHSFTELYEHTLL